MRVTIVRAMNQGGGLTAGTGLFDFGACSGPLAQGLDRFGRARPCLAISGVSPPFLRCAPVQGRRFPSPLTGPDLRHSPARFASRQKPMAPIAFGSILGRETKTWYA